MMGIKEIDTVSSSTKTDLTESKKNEEVKKPIYPVIDSLAKKNVKMVDVLKMKSKITRRSRRMNQLRLSYDKYQSV